MANNTFGSVCVCVSQYGKYIEFHVHSNNFQLNHLNRINGLNERNNEKNNRFSISIEVTQFVIVLHMTQYSCLAWFVQLFCSKHCLQVIGRKFLFVWSRPVDLLVSFIHLYRMLSIKFHIRCSHTNPCVYNFIVAQSHFKYLPIQKM